MTLQIKISHEDLRLEGGADSIHRGFCISRPDLDARRLASTDTVVPTAIHDSANYRAARKRCVRGSASAEVFGLIICKNFGHKTFLSAFFII